MWERAALYLKKAGTLILSASILVWFMTNYPGDVSYSKDYEASMGSVKREYDAKVAGQVLTPLGVTALEGSTALSEAVTRIRELESLEGVSSATIKAPVEGMAVVTSATAKAPPGAKGLKLAEFAQTEPKIFPLAVKYLELERQRDDAFRQLKTEQTAEKLANSYAGRFGQLLEPLVKPLGFDWKIAVGLVTAVAAKEILVSTLGTIYSVGEVEEDDMTSLQSALLSDSAFSPLVAYGLMVFTLIYSPCLAALSVMRRETNSWKWTVFSFVYSTLLAWGLAFIIHQAGSALGL
jgi:ferrous iron transport protein B